jgi:hypothetical protein
MDDLDRLAFRVARTVRTTYPHLLEHGFTLSDLEERLAPFPEARREMASNGPDGYELTILRLLAGERGYLTAEPELQQACRRALQMPSPTVSIVRTWAGSTLTLRNPAFILGAERTSGAYAAAHTTGDNVTYAEPAARTAEPDARCSCHFCGGSLPSGRSLTFCPFCGLNLTVRQCPACSTELERTWRFCVTCGRQADDADEHTPPTTGDLAVVASAGTPTSGVFAAPSTEPRRTL